MELKIKAIIEILGKPKDHVEKTIANVVEELKKREGLTLINEKIAKTKKLETFFSSYVEVELKLSTMDQLIDFCFDFLPSNIEIIEPEEMNLDSHLLAEYMNDLLAKLHQQSMIIRNMHAENLVMKQKLGLTK
ncbi:hypothetical protein J4442_05185 [Candidatus Woesearchaeota archaeon]|nr:hypothetical protein [Candidatus Woesearchaeota archaeon]